MDSLGPTTPVLRIFDETKARDFYVGFLGFSVDFEHRFGPEMPLYMGVSRSACVLHLSEHHGDAVPGAHIRIATRDVVALQASLADKNYKFAKPGKAEATPWGSLELSITDPFGNRLTFVQGP